jgi:two-component system sensor histidine kinase KdpD
MAWHFIPLRTQRRLIGVVGVGKRENSIALDPEERGLLTTLTEQTAAALDRSFLTQEMMTARSAAETERVRNILLASISHDFRTPLASILGSATCLLGYRHHVNAQDQIDLLAQIKSEAEGLDMMVRNLLAITRIDAGALELRRDWVDLREIVDRVVSATRRRKGWPSLVATLPAELPMIRADAILLEQALSNVVNNAVSHTPNGTRVTVDAQVSTHEVALRVTDNGPGIPADILPQVFEKFVHSRHAINSDRGEGTGLGLAIAKGVVEAHGGSITAESPVFAGLGTRLALKFPRE